MSDSLVIAIDIGRDQFYIDQLKSWITNNQSISGVIACNWVDNSLQQADLKYYGVPLPYHRDIHTNSIEHYSQSTHGTIARWWSTHNDLTEFDDWQEYVEYMQVKTSPFLRFHNTTDPPFVNSDLRDDQQLVGCWTLEQLVYLINHVYTQATNIYFVGGDVKQCLIDRPTGIRAVHLANKQGQLFNRPLNIFALADYIHNIDGKVVSATAASNGYSNLTLQQVQIIQQYNQKHPPNDSILDAGVRSLLNLPPIQYLESLEKVFQPAFWTRVNDNPVTYQLTATDLPAKEILFAN